jgi:HEPN domain-containing protein
MGYYDDALEWHGTAIDMISCGRYRASVYMSCLSVECFLKSAVAVFDSNNPRMNEHDTIYFYRLLKEKHPHKADLSSDIRLCRKYHTDARYSNSVKPELYTKDFANRFLDIVTTVKEYVDNECAATEDDLLQKFKKSICEI